MRSPVIILALLLAIATAPAPVFGISIRMHTAASLSACAASVPPFMPVDIRVMAHMEGALANGISGVEFYIEGLENLTDVIINYTQAPKITGFGNPLKPVSHPNGPRRRAAFGFQRRVQECKAVSEYELIFTMTLIVISTPIPNDTHIRIVGADPPGSPALLGCAVVSLCDFPAFTKICVHGGEFVLNPVNSTCANPTTNVLGPQPVAWSRIKGLYR